jgi:hypothetical protein
MNIDIESSIIAGNPVKFVYLDPGGDKSKYISFDARCHFLPAIGQKVIFGATNQIAFVKNIYHNFLQSDDFEPGVFAQIVTVVLTSEAPLAPAREFH